MVNLFEYMVSGSEDMIVFKLIDYKVLSIGPMNKLTLSLGEQQIELSIEDCKSPLELVKLVQTAFQLKEDILGVTDSAGKFYELEYLWQNMPTFNNHKLALITARESGDNVSFGSRRSKRNQFSISSKKQRCLGKINDLETFRKFLSKGITVIVTLLETDSTIQVPFDHYRVTGSPRWLELWQDSSPILNCQICENIELFFEWVVTYLKHWSGGGEGLSEVFPDPQQVMNGEAKQTMILQAFEQLLQEGAMSELQFYKKKTLLLEKPHCYVNRFFTGQTIDRSELIERIRQDFIKQKQEVRILEMISNSPTKRQALARTDSNNIIQKVTSQHQVTLQQEQVLNLLLQLETQGLITEQEMETYQGQALAENPFLLQLVREYFESEWQPLQLARRLKKAFNQRKQEKKLIQ